MMALQEQEQQQQSVLVEDIPSHEIYTSLVGIKPRPSPLLQQQLAPSSSEVAIVEIGISERRQNNRTEFWRTYMKSKEIQFSSMSIDSSNKGFKLLSNMGWREKDGGLGKRRQGSMLPIQTVLKADTLGVGAGKRKIARITHKHTNKEEIIVQDRKVTKAERKRLRQLEQDEANRQDKIIRMMLRSDVPDADEALYARLH